MNGPDTVQADAADLRPRPELPGDTRRQREMLFFMRLATDCAARAEQHGSSLQALGLRRLATGYLTIAASFSGEPAGEAVAHARRGRSREHENTADAGAMTRSAA